jgi:hypothetical protein
MRSRRYVERVSFKRSLSNKHCYLLLLREMQRSFAGNHTCPL